MPAPAPTKPARDEANRSRDDADLIRDAFADADAWLGVAPPAGTGIPSFAGTGIPSGSSDVPADAPVGRMPVSNPFASSALPSVPGFRLIRETHRGGQGIVYEAAQLSTDRIVAVKFMLGGPLAGPIDRTRFDREVRILARLQHPGIVNIYDTGVAAGCRYFVMDYIAGQPIDEYVQSARLDTRATLELFARVCDIVFAAHVRGFIHRDLKPSHILIDDDGQPHIVDFGLGKIIDPDETAGTGIPSSSPPAGIPSGRANVPADVPVGRMRENAAETGILRAAGTGIPSGSSIAAERRTPSSSADRTATGQFIGSLAWASPEQAAGRHDDLDTRTDVYSLGVILYYILTERFPYSVEGNPHAVLNRIINTPPEAPRQHLPSKTRSGDEIEAILLKSLAKDPVGRYQSAGELAADIRRYLTGDAIEAKRDSRWYVLRKAVRRHRAAVTIASSFVLLVTSAAVVFGVMYQNQSRERARAEEHKKLAEAAQGRERAQRELAEKREKQTQDVSGFQGAMLSGIDVEAMGRGIKESFREQVRAALERQYVGEFPDRRKRTPEEVEAELLAFDQRAGAAQAVDVARRVVDEFVLARAADALEERFDDQPLVQAQIHFALGSAYLNLGLFHIAESHLRAALELRQRELGEKHALVTDSLTELGWLLIRTGAHVAAEPLLRQALALRRKLYGDESCEVANVLNPLGLALGAKGDVVEAQLLLREALAMHRKLLGVEHPNTAETMNNLALQLTPPPQTVYSGRVPPDRTIDFSSTMASTLAEAEELYTEALAIMRKVYAHEHRSVATTLKNLGDLLTYKGECAAAELRYREALEIQRKLLGDEHPDVMLTLGEMARMLEEKRDYATLEPLYHEMLAMCRNLLGDEHPDVAGRLHSLAMVLHQRGDSSAAEPLFREALAMQRRLLPADHTSLANTLSGCARLLFSRGQYAEAESMLRETLAIREKAKAQNSLQYANELMGLSRILVPQERYAEAESVAREGLRTIRAIAAKDRDWLPDAVNVLAQTLVASGKPDEAILVWRECVEDYRRLLPADDVSLASALASLGPSLLQQGNYAEVEPILRECLAIREKAFGPDSRDYWLLMNTRSMLGGALTDQGAPLIESDHPAAIAKFTEAEPLLLDSAEWLTQNAERIPEQYRAARLREALERIVKLYESWDIVAPHSGKAEQAARWRGELEQLPGP